MFEDFDPATILFLVIRESGVRRFHPSCQITLVIRGRGARKFRLSGGIA
jgi:hypothetical protein